jgi:hypothetical protein
MGDLRTPRRWLLDHITRILLEPLPFYDHPVPNDFANLKRYIRTGDVILVDGDQRISLVIKYLTQSSWSHCALYVGDEPLRRHPELEDELVARFGDEAQHLIVEALLEGVVLSPVSKYIHLNIRVTRPYNLRKEDRARMLDEILSRVGYRYDVKSIVDLARYFFPLSLVPHRFRRVTVGSGRPAEVICSSMIAQAFHEVGFPIGPRVEYTQPPVPPPGLVDRLLRRRPPRVDRYYRRPPALVTPRDFDLSPYFEIVKFNFIEEMKFDYRKILWADDQLRAKG